ncbi:MAG TPA: SHOCT domain-containing protein, partial [Arachnia sp.]|nr:SHOCT domain-containing protein [Arachnia sp.]
AAKQQRAAAAAPVASPAPAPASPAPAPAPTAPVAPDTGAMLEQLRQLGELRAAGVLTDAEFEAQKARILAS